MKKMQWRIEGIENLWKMKENERNLQNRCERKKKNEKIGFRFWFFMD
jgi:hypothetical protein